VTFHEGPSLVSPTGNRFLPLQFNRNSCNPRRLAFLLRQPQTKIVVFLQDIDKKRFFAIAQLVSLTLPPEKHLETNSRDPTITPSSTLTSSTLTSSTLTSSLPPTMTKEQFHDRILAELQDIVEGNVAFSQTEGMINRCHPPIGKKSVSQAVNGQEVEMGVAEQLKLMLVAPKKTSSHHFYQSHPHHHHLHHSHHSHPSHSHSHSHSPQTKDKEQQQSTIPITTTTTTTTTILPTTEKNVVLKKGEAFRFLLTEEETKELTEEELWKKFFSCVQEQLEGARILHASVVGSRRYGVGMIDSDYDLWSVCLLSFPRYCSLTQPALHIQHNPAFTFPDYVLVECQDYFRLLLDGDPRAVESLFIAHPYHQDPLLQPLLDRRHAFLTTRLVQKMLQDATSSRKLGSLISESKISSSSSSTLSSTTPTTTSPSPSLPSSSSSSSSLTANTIIGPTLEERRKLWYLVHRLLFYGHEALYHGRLTIPLTGELQREIMTIRTTPLELFHPHLPYHQQLLDRCLSLIREIEHGLTLSLLPHQLSDETIHFLQSLLLQLRLIDIPHSLLPVSS
jgi:hypothetical protein